MVQEGRKFWENIACKLIGKPFHLGLPPDSICELFCLLRQFLRLELYVEGYRSWNSGVKDMRFSVETLTLPQLFSSVPHFFPQVCFSLQPISSVSQESKSSEVLGMRIDESWLFRGESGYFQWKQDVEVHQEKGRKFSKFWGCLQAVLPGWMSESLVLWRYSPGLTKE